MTRPRRHCARTLSTCLEPPAALASPGLAAACAGSRWLCAEEQLRWSDHPPVVADFAALGTSRK